MDELVNAAHFFKPEESAFEILPENAEALPEFPILAFLSNAALESGEAQAEQGQDAVQLMTIHAAKGLEFDTVFLSGLEEGRFPSEFSLKEQGGIAEERRLMYVAITRARRRLYLSMAQQRLLHGQTQFGTTSRFVDEIPAHLMHLLRPKKQPAPAATNSPQRRVIGQEVAQKQPAQDFDGFHIGQNVRHEKFGTGVIIDAVQRNNSARLTINFGKQGIKELDTAFAKLEKR